MAERKNLRKTRRQQEKVGECFFCKEKQNPAFLNQEILSRFTSERGKILPRLRSGICAKHQRKLTREVKKARYMALLPYVVSPD